MLLGLLEVALEGILELGRAGGFGELRKSFARQAITVAKQFEESGVTSFEEPVSSDDLSGLRLVRQRAPDAMEITAGEYGYGSRLAEQ